MSITVLRVLEYTYDNEETMKADMAGWLDKPFTRTGMKVVSTSFPAVATQTNEPLVSQGKGN